MEVNEAIYEGAANRLEKEALKSGQLCLTSTSLVYRDQEMEEIMIGIRDIHGLYPMKSRFLGIPLLSKGLIVQTKKGEIHRFAMGKVEKWKSEITKAMRKVKIF
ncbi:hypothetical protein [Falsibacillus pallidus]|uniref:GRAM domain-containing protein n=1 Tax=Falsibacillus pallidus TaxID=493781 RepID=A0A370GSY1_9BACI|nr:hypothetical protein [Falsibacillus pallidus]RDI45634.1 hypothetical protein DFR59_102265 [Falsibacillus pallidus]